MDLNPNYKYTIYKTTNKLNDKIYIGCHKTQNLDDGYIGSGTILKRAIAKYGIENFEKEILFVFDTSEEMFAKEAEIVDKIFVDLDTTYNILEGGRGGFDYVNSSGKNLYGQNGSVGYGRENLMPFNKVRQYLISVGKWEDYKKSICAGMKEKIQRDGHWWVGKKHTEETKKKIGAALSKAQRGSGNSQYGTCWIYSVSGENKKIRKEDLESHLSMGWLKGRKM